MSLTLMCGFFCLAFTFDNEGIHWLWEDSKPIAIILGISAIILGLFYLKASRQVKIEG